MSAPTATIQDDSGDHEMADVSEHQKSEDSDPSNSCEMEESEGDMFSGFDQIRSWLLNNGSAIANSSFPQS